jgi:serine/threonine-protein kinase
LRKTRQVGRYHVTERIAFGGMAEIYRAFTYDADGFRRDVAIKQVLPNFVQDGQFIDMLRDEFRLVSCLRHPNIAEVYELARVDDTILIAMEFVDGKDLRTVVDRARASGIKLDADDVAYTMARALDGLHHAHVAVDPQGAPLKIVHRDFSPSNILVAYDGHVKICDFGIAKAEHNRVQTRTGIIKGKIKYMSPEQAFGKKLDGRSDVFSAGSVLYELLCGEAPFTAPNEVDLIFAVREAAPRPIRSVDPTVHPALAAIVERSMSRSRSARYQTALEFRDALLGWLRTFAPHYKRTKLARLMKRLFAREIEHELRAMEQYVVSEAPRGALGENLIADALGPDAAYATFSPSPTRTTHASDQRAEGGFAGIDEEESLPPVSDAAPLHAARTEILDARVVRSRRRRARAVDDASTRGTRPVSLPLEEGLADEKTVRAPAPSPRRDA